MKKMLLITIILCNITNLNSLSYRNSNLISIASALTSGWVANKAQEIFTPTSNDYSLKNILAFFLTGIVVKTFTNKYTPKQALKNVKKSIEEINDDQYKSLLLIGKYWCEDKDTFFKYVEIIFKETDFTLALTYYDLSNLLIEYTNIDLQLQNIIKTADAEIHVKEEAKKIEAIIKIYYPKIYKAVDILRSHPLFHIQKTKFEKFVKTFHLNPKDFRKWLDEIELRTFRFLNSYIYI